VDGHTKSINYDRVVGDMCLWVTDGRSWCNEPFSESFSDESLCVTSIASVLARRGDRFKCCQTQIRGEFSLGPLNACDTHTALRGLQQHLDPILRVGDESFERFGAFSERGDGEHGLSLHLPARQQLNGALELVV